MGCDILIGTIGRILQLLIKNCIPLINIKYVILDEADKLLDNPVDIDKILNHDLMPSGSEKNVLMFTATLQKKSLAEFYLNEYVLLFEEGNMGGACHNVVQAFLEISSNGKREKLLELLKSSDAISTVVFANSPKQAANLAQFLCDSGMPCSTLHGGLTLEARNIALKDFKGGYRSILVATDIASRGLGKYNLRSYYP